MGDVFDRVASKSSSGDIFDRITTAAPTGPRGEVGNIRPPNPILDDDSVGNYYSGPGAWPSPKAEVKAAESPTYDAAVGVPLATAAAVMGGPPVARAIAGQAAKHPLITSMLASEAISQARKIPYVGKLVPPYAEMLPWLRGGKAAEGSPEPLPAEGEVQQPLEGEYVDSPAQGEYVDSPAQLQSRNIPTINATEVTPRAPEPAPAPYRKVGGFEPEDVNVPDPNVLGRRTGVRVPPKRNLALPAATPETQTARPSLVEEMGGKPVESVTESAAYTTGPGPAIQRGPVPGSAEDIAESKSLAEQVREAAEGEQRKFASQQRRDWFRRNQPGASKSDLVKQAGGTIPDKPVTFTRTPSGAIKPLGPKQNLLQALKDSLKQAKEQRAAQPPSQ